MQIRFGLLGPLSAIHDGQAALMTSGNQRIAVAAPLRTENWAQASRLLTIALSFWHPRALGDVPSELLANHHGCHK